MMAELVEVTVTGDDSTSDSLLPLAGGNAEDYDLTLVFPNNCPSDLNSDGIVNINDLLIVLSDYGCIGAGCAGDADGDALVGIGDILEILAVYGMSCY